VCNGNEETIKKESARDESACAATLNLCKEEAEVVEQERGQEGRLPQATAGAADEE
jgi:hypothetical protein